MAQVSAKLRSYEGGYMHWCPGCHSMHMIAVSEPFENGARWTFDGSLDAPTFNPSVLISIKRRVIADGKWTGEWASVPHCHYFLRAGIIEFCGDSTHALAGRDVPLPDLPQGLQS